MAISQAKLDVIREGYRNAESASGTWRWCKENFPQHVISEKAVRKALAQFKHAWKKEFAQERKDDAKLQRIRLAGLSDWEEILFDTVKDAVAEIRKQIGSKTFSAQDAFALKGCVEAMCKLVKRTIRPDFGSKQSFQVWLDTLREDKDIGPLIDAKWEKLVAKFKLRMAQANLAIEDEV